MNKSILITGISGTGKTTIAEEMKKRGFNAYSIEDDIDGLFDMYHTETKQKATGHFEQTLDNAKNHDWICDIKMLKELIEKNSNKTTYYFGVASNLKEIIPFFDELILLTANEECLRHRLTHRTTNDFGLTSDVQDWVFSWKDWFEDGVKDFHPIVIDTNKKLDNLVEEIAKIGSR